MKKWMSMGGAWILGAVCAMADVTAPAAASPPGIPAEEVVLDLTCVLPTNGPGVARGELVARLHAYDPRTADGAAKEICRVAISGLSHRAGEETVLRFPCVGGSPQRKAYYITAVVYPEGAAADSAGLYFIDGFQEVLTDGSRQSLTVILSPVDGGGGEPSN